VGLLLKRAADGVKILDAGAPGTVQHFSTHAIQQGTADGWITLSGNRVVLTGTGGALVYRLDRPPGIYCCHCEQGFPEGDVARGHVAETHPGVASPDGNNPAGYRYDHFFATTRLE
jgi:hypothetical protein